MVITYVHTDGVKIHAIDFQKGKRIKKARAKPAPLQRFRTTGDLSRPYYWNALIPVTSIPVMSRCMSCVPS